MSHIPQRKEKDCLNCGTVVQGPYCHACGQENVVPKETFWHMVTHFFNDITHFDGSFFTTSKDLLFKPGFLSKEYMAGKRAKYLHPVRMYVFTSAFFFLLFFWFFAKPESIVIDTNTTINGKDRLKKIAKLEKEYLNDESKAEVLARLQELKDTTIEIPITDIPLFIKDFTVINLSGDGDKYKTVEAYNVAQQKLPAKDKDGWFKRRMVQKEISVNKKYSSDPAAATEDLSTTFLHRLPYLLFVSLPLFALILRLAYLRRKQFYYADHSIFTIHLYIFTFILLLLVFSLNSLQRLTDWGFIDYLIGALFLTLAVYLYKAMRYFYGQGRIKTFFKLLFVLFSSLLLMALLFAFFLFFTAVSL